MILLIRLIPFAVGLLEAIVFWQQQFHPTLYPWILMIGLVAFPLGAVAIAHRNLGIREIAGKLTPSFILLVALAFAFLLTEKTWQFVLLEAFAGVSSFLSLEVLFLMVHHPSAYPVNGISRVNISYVPIIMWYAISTSIGLVIFIHSDRIWHVLMAAVLGYILFRTTSHPDATRSQNRIWSLVGICTGIEIGLVGLLLPVSMAMQGLIAAVIMSGVLRMRRYLYNPKPSHRVAWSEAIGMIVIAVVSLSTAKWF